MPVFLFPEYLQIDRQTDNMSLRPRAVYVMLLSSTSFSMAGTPSILEAIATFLLIRVHTV